MNSGDRYGAASADEPLAAGNTATITLYAANVNASGSQSWKVAKGTYNLKADLSKMQVSLEAVDAAVDSIDFDDDTPIQFFNLQGVRIDNPIPGTVYIMVQGRKSAKVLLR